MKVEITGASNFVNRMFEACGNYQWARECLKNALEAGAARVEFGVEWQAVQKHGVYRRTAADDGAGMDRQELLRFFSTLGDGAKAIGGVHDNFGVGAKVSTLPWNPAGVVVISYKDGRGSMIWMRLDPEAADYELAEFETANGRACVIEPDVIDGIDWAAVGPGWLKEHGTVIVLLGSGEHPDTVLGNPGAEESRGKGLSGYLDTRFWNLGGADVRVVELPGRKKERWPRGAEETDAARRLDVPTILGARRHLSRGKTSSGRESARGRVKLASGRVTARWYLRPVVADAKKGGYVAVMYKGELFHVTADKGVFRALGVVESAVQQNLTVVLEPALYRPDDGEWGVHPDQSRNRLLFTADGERGARCRWPPGAWSSPGRCPRRSARRSARPARTRPARVGATITKSGSASSSGSGGG